MDKQAIAKLTNEQIESRIQDKAWVIARLKQQVLSNEVSVLIDEALVSLSLLLDEANYRRNHTAIPSKVIALLLVDIEQSIITLREASTDKFLTNVKLEEAKSAIAHYFSNTHGKIDALALLENFGLNGRAGKLRKRLYEAQMLALKGQAAIREAQATEGGAA
jgi:hypothetical protein